MNHLLKSLSTSVAATLMLVGRVSLAETPELHVVLEDHRFLPDTLVAPTGVKFRLIIHNRDASPEEFESYSLGREKVVNGKSSIVVFLGPLKPGSYDFFGDFNADTAHGQIVAK